jgi:hypothetical protein
MHSTIKIVVLVLVVAAAIVLAHHLPGFEGLMRKIHGG